MSIRLPEAARKKDGLTRVIRSKLSLPIHTNNTQIKPLWISMESSIHVILSSLDSAEMVTLLTASTFLTSITYAMISAQRLVGRSNRDIENMIKIEMETILNTIQQLKSDPDEFISDKLIVIDTVIHHINNLIDNLLIFISLPECNKLYKVSLTSTHKRYSQPIFVSKSESAESMASNKGDKIKTASKKFIHSLKSRPVFHVTLLPNRHSVEPMIADYIPKKDGSHHVTPKSSDTDNKNDPIIHWRKEDGRDSISVHSDKTKDEANSSLSSIFSGQSSNVSTKKRKGIKELFQNNSRRRDSMNHSSNNQISSASSHHNLSNSQITDHAIANHCHGNRSNSISGNCSSYRNNGNTSSHRNSHGNSNHHEGTNSHGNNKSHRYRHSHDTSSLQTIIKETNPMQGPFSSSFTFTSIPSAEDMKPNLTLSEESTFTHLMSPFKHNDWNHSQVNGDEGQVDDKPWKSPQHSFVFNNENETGTERTRKRSNNGSPVPVPPPKAFTSIPMARDYSPLPPLPIMDDINTTNIPNSPDSFYFSARSSSSSQSSIQTSSIEDVMEGLRTIQLESIAGQLDMTEEDIPPPVPPKDHTPDRAKVDLQRGYTMDIDMKEIQSMNKEIKLSLNDISPNPLHLKFKRPSIPPRTSSMPLPLSKINYIPSLPSNTLKVSMPHRRRLSKSITDKSSWSLFWGIDKREEEDTKKARLGRSTVNTKKVKKTDHSSLIKVIENEMVVILLEIIEGKPQIVAGTDDKLFEKLFDKTMQEIDYIDIYLVNHTDFITSETLLSQLIIRFSTQLPGEDYNYQEKVLEIISHWVFFQSEDFRCNDALERQLTSFLSDKNILLNHRKEVEAIMINLNKKSYLTNKYTAHPTSHLACSVTSFNLHSNNSSLPPVHFSHNPIKPYGLFDITPPDSPTTYISSLSSIINIESKDIARYLTLADYYLFKSIRSHHLFRTKISHPTDEHKEEPDFIHLMTKRANMLTHWVAHEICSMTQLKLKRALLRKFIDVAKLCYEWNNFHTCMVIIMGLTSLSNLIETWDSLSNRDMNTFDSLSKLLDVSLNMRYYRQKIKSAKSPCIPFLPVVLKDFTFYNENPTYLLSHPDLINFAKFRSVYQFILQTKSLTEEEYWFASELIHFPFMPIPMPSSSIMNSFNQMADWIECRLDRVESCYLHCSLLS